MKKLVYIFAALLLTGICACGPDDIANGIVPEVTPITPVPAPDDSIPGDSIPGDSIPSDTTYNPSEPPKLVPITFSSGSNTRAGSLPFDSFYVIAIYNGDEDFNNFAVYCEQVNGTSTFRGYLDEPYYWPRTGSLTFYAYANCSAGSISDITEGASHRLTLNENPTGTISLQEADYNKDILFAAVYRTDCSKVYTSKPSNIEDGSDDAEEYKSSVALKFKHIMSNVSISIKNASLAQMDIQSISYSADICNTFTPSTNKAGKHTWTSVNNPTKATGTYTLVNQHVIAGETTTPAVLTQQDANIQPPTINVDFTVNYKKQITISGYTYYLPNLQDEAVDAEFSVHPDAAKGETMLVGGGGSKTFQLDFSDKWIIAKEKDGKTDVNDQGLFIISNCNQQNNKKPWYFYFLNNTAPSNKNLPQVTQIDKSFASDTKDDIKDAGIVEFLEGKNATETMSIMQTYLYKISKSSNNLVIQSAISNNHFRYTTNLIGAPNSLYFDEKEEHYDEWVATDHEESKIHYNIELKFNHQVLLVTYTRYLSINSGNFSMSNSPTNLHLFKYMGP